MKHLLPAAALLLSLPAAAADVERVTRGNLVIEGIPEIPPALIERMRSYQNTRQATLAGWTPDGQLTVVTRFGNTSQLHLVAQPMGARHQITFFDEPISGGSWSPTGARRGIAYLRDAGGNENFQLEYLDPDAGSPLRVTDGRGRAGGAVWSHDGTRFAFTWTARNGTVADIYVDDPLDRRAPELVYEAGEVGWFAGDWSPDGRSLGLGRFVSANESYLYVYDLASRTMKEIEPSPVKAARFNAVFAQDGSVYFTSDLGSEFQVLRHYDPTSGRITTLTGEVPWDVEDIAISRDGRYLAYVINEDGASRLRLRDLGSGRELAPPALPFGVIGAIRFEPKGHRLAFALQTPAAPFDVWVYSPSDGELVRWTKSELGPLNASKFVAPTLVRYPSFDRDGRKPRQIPAWVYKPAGPGPHPVLINIHGGPEAQSRPIFSIATQQWAGELGYAVIAPNVRGSTGYGKTYVALDNGMKREDSVRDIGALLDWIATQPDLDAKRVVLVVG